jgi:hypothetical protein
MRWVHTLSLVLGLFPITLSGSEDIDKNKINKMKRKEKKVEAPAVQQDAAIEAIDPVRLGLFEPQSWVDASAKGDLQSLQKALSNPLGDTSKAVILQQAAEIAGINGQANVIELVQQQVLDLSPADQHLVIQKLFIGVIKGGHPELLADLVQHYGGEYLTHYILQFAGRRPKLSENFPNAPKWGTDIDYKNMLSFLKQKVEGEPQKIQVLTKAKDKERPYITDFTSAYVSSVEDIQYQQLVRENKAIRSHTPPQMRSMFNTTPGKYKELGKTMDMKVWRVIDGEGTVTVFTPEQLGFVEVGADANGHLVYKNGPAKGLTMNEFGARVRLNPKDVEWMYVVDTTGRMFIINRKNGQVHSSLAGGKPVVAAGTLQFNGAGDLVQITEDSGHYKFKDHVVIPYTEMQAMGVNLSKAQIVPSQFERLSPNNRMLRSVVTQTIKKVQIDKQNRDKSPEKMAPARNPGSRPVPVRPPAVVPKTPPTATPPIR